MDNDILVRCKNWADEPAICGESCGVWITSDEADGVKWVNAVLEDSPEWLIVLRSCPEHRRHLDAYCSIACFSRYHMRHGHADDDLVAPIDTEGHRS